MTALLVDVVIASGFVAACFLTALVLYGVTFDVSRWWHARHDDGAEAAPGPLREWGDVDVDWSEFDRRAA